MPPLAVKVTDFNRSEHLDKVVSLSVRKLQKDVLTFPQKRQKGGIGSTTYDPKQQDIRAFFGGGAAEKPEEGRSESNARDEAEVDIDDPDAQF